MHVAIHIQHSQNVMAGSVRSDIFLSLVRKYPEFPPRKNEMNRALGHLCAHIG